MRIGRAAGVTDTGRRRLRNEDAFICEPPLFAVADGMGGARAGEIAAGLAAAALEEAGTETRGAEGIAELITEANRRIWERSVADPRTAGMGTTVTAALVDAAGGTVAIGHVGDSRAYLLRDGDIDQLTTDHSLVAELVQSGVLTPEEAERHPQRSAITRALGTEATVDVESFTVDAEPGDVFLLCSDGLSTMLSDEEVAAVVEEAGSDLGRAADGLVAAANARGGDDNVTVVLFEIVADDALGASDVDERETTVVAPEAPAPSGEPGTSESAEPSASTLEGDTDTEDASAASHSRFGAGPGGRVAALLVIASLLGLGLLALYWVAAR